MSPLLLPLALAACGGGGGGGGADLNGVLNLSVTDSPVDEATNVLVEFTGVELKQVEGASQSYDLSGDSLSCLGWLNGDSPSATPDGEPTIRCIDLLALNGGASELILDGVTVPAGDYNSIRLAVNAARGELDSIFVDVIGGWHSLYIPSGEQSGLKLNSTYSIGPGGENDFVIEFDLRKSVNNPEGFEDYRLKPSLKLMENSRTGIVFGEVDSLLVTADTCENGDMHDMGNVVYVFEGDVEPIDYQGEATDPFMSGMVKADEQGIYRYRVAFLPEGIYTLAFTCQGVSDRLEEPDEIAFSPEPPTTRVIEVSPGSEQEVSFE